MTEQIHIRKAVSGDEEELRRLENSYLAEIGEEPITQEKLTRLSQAIARGEITFLLARRGDRAVGMCSLVTPFSTFACAPTAIFEDFYIDPPFRRQGIARLLVRAAQDWCMEKGVSSLTVTCAPCDQAMYQALDFDIPLGSTFAHIFDS